MSHFVLVTYRNAFAAAAIAPFTLLSERPVIDQNLYYAGLKLTSPTFAGAVTNIVPALTFIISIICRMEKVEMRKVRFQAKVVGTLVIVVGAMLMTLFESPLINFLRSHLIGDASSPAVEDYLKATVFLLIASFSWAYFFVLQAATLKRYSSHLTLSTMGIMSSGIAYYVQGVTTKKKSAVFVTAFNPLIVIIGSIIGLLILGQRLYPGRVLAMAILMVGVCVILWGKEGDEEENSEDTFVEFIKGCIGCRNNMPRIDEEVDVEMGKAKMVVDLL
ncbi:unnamed protein product [Eruca vesicaria subsp. sativa]|uniref:WAT1-related protein n=1 Tax=Eruca vesicaria subsp. sativa TaxID=29727 RepID=A0ABC8JTL5_ERUVS|nr:unnamed protein product [Eruca vesicaria subsp. sativa]